MPKAKARLVVRDYERFGSCTRSAAQAARAPAANGRCDAPALHGRTLGAAGRKRGSIQGLLGGRARPGGPGPAGRRREPSTAAPRRGALGRSAGPAAGQHGPGPRRGGGGGALVRDRGRDRVGARSDVARRAQARASRRRSDGVAARVRGAAAAARSLLSRLLEPVQLPGLDADRSDRGCGRGARRVDALPARGAFSSDRNAGRAAVRDERAQAGMDPQRPRGVRAGVRRRVSLSGSLSDEVDPAAARRVGEASSGAGDVPRRVGGQSPHRRAAEPRGRPRRGRVSRRRDPRPRLRPGDQRSPQAQRPGRRKRSGSAARPPTSSSAMACRPC